MEILYAYVDHGVIDTLQTFKDDLHNGPDISFPSDQDKDASFTAAFRAMLASRV